VSSLWYINIVSSAAQAFFLCFLSTQVDSDVIPLFMPQEKLSQ